MARAALPKVQTRAPSPQIAAVERLLRGGVVHKARVISIAGEGLEVFCDCGQVGIAHELRTVVEGVEHGPVYSGMGVAADLEELHDLRFRPSAEAQDRIAAQA